MKKYFLLLIICSGINTAIAQLYISNGAEIKMTGTAVLTLQDINLVNDGTFNQTEGTVRFTGNANNTISGANVIHFYNVELAKATNNQVALLRHINADNQIGFTSGIIDLNGFNILLSASALFTGESESSHITGNGGGYVEITNVLNAPAAANPGNLGAIITAAANMGNTVIRRGHQSQVNGVGTGNSIFRYYDIIPAANTGLNATLQFQYFDAELNGLSENVITQWKSDDTTTWVNLGFATRNTATNYVEQNGIANFSRWTLSTPGNVLPVTGLELSGQWENNVANLRWKTETEINNHHFVIQRFYKNGQQQFAGVSTIPSKHIGGNSSSTTWYNFADAASATQGNIFYRIKQVDIDNRISYSNTISVSPKGALVFIDKTYPAIVQSQLNIKTGNAHLQKMTVTIYDMTGKLVLQKTLSYQSQQLALPAMSAGMYQLKIQSEEWEYNSRLLKQ